MTRSHSEVVGSSPAVTHALELVNRFAPTPLPILLVGATGTGKEVFAALIHRLSKREGPFLPVNCAALPREMFESLLFGHRRGAFTGALEATVGFVEAAHGGTLFLDELASLPSDAQAKLLRVLETKHVTRLGETASRPVDFRVVASGQGDLAARVSTGMLRLDLYERLAGVVVGLPPLRDRLEDVVALAEHFASQLGRTLEPGSGAVLCRYGWPGNVRELRTVIERAACLSANGTVGPVALEGAIALGAVDCPRVLRRDRQGERADIAHHRNHLVAACRDAGWDARRAARELGIHPSTLYRRLQTQGMSLRALRVADIRANSHTLPATG